MKLSGLIPFLSLVTWPGCVPASYLGFVLVYLIMAIEFLPPPPLPLTA